MHGILMLNTTCNIDALNWNEIYIPRYLQKIRFHFNKKHVPIKKYIHSSIVKITEAVNNRDKTWKGIHRGKRSKRECTLYFCTMYLTFILIYRTFLCEMKYHENIFHCKYLHLNIFVNIFKRSTFIDDDICLTTLQAPSGRNCQTLITSVSEPWKYLSS